MDIRRGDTRFKVGISCRGVSVQIWVKPVPGYEGGSFQGLAEAVRFVLPPVPTEEVKCAVNAITSVFYTEDCAEFTMGYQRFSFRFIKAEESGSGDCVYVLQPLGEGQLGILVWVRREEAGKLLRLARVCEFGYLGVLPIKWVKTMVYPLRPCVSLVVGNYSRRRALPTWRCNSRNFS